MKRLLGILLFGFLVCNSLAQVTPIVPQTYILGGIRIEGAEGVEEFTVRAILGLRKGDTIKIPGDEIKEAVKRIWAQGIFATVKLAVDTIVGDSVFLVLYVESKPRVSRYTIKGVRKSEAEELANVIGKLKGKAVTSSFLRSLEARVKRYYVNEGYLFARVDIEVLPDTIDGWRILVFKIRKGPRARIYRIEFEGNKAFSDRQLKKRMKETKEQPRVELLKDPSFRELICGSDKICEFTELTDPWLLFLNVYDYIASRVNVNIFASSRFDEDKFRADLNRIIEFYNEHGFRDARIVRDSVIVLPDSNLLISIVINEGSRYYFGNIFWSGNVIYSDSLLNGILGIKKGDLYSRKKLMSRLTADPAGNDVASLYMDQGYLFFNVSAREVRVYDDTIDVEIRVYEGPKATIDRVLISGNYKTHDHVIRRELWTDPGNVFSRRDLIRSQQQLAALGLFDPENLNVRPEPDPVRGTVDLHYEVSERPSDQVELSAGYGGGILIGSLGLILNNFSFRELFTKEGWDPIPSGDAQRLTIRAQSSYGGYRAITFSVSDPWFGGRKPNSFSFTAYYNVFYSSFYSLYTTDPSAVVRANKQETWGGSVSWGFRLKFPDDYFMLFSSVEYQRIALSQVSQELEGMSSGRAINLFGELKLTRNSLDQLLYPRRGASTSVTLRLTPPYTLFRRWSGDSVEWDDRYSLLEYYKVKFDAEWYIPLTNNRKLVAKFRYSFGLMGPYNAVIGTPPLERFELGGDGFSNFAIYGREVVSLRGYDPFIFGARAFQKVTFELRYPLSLSPMSTIYVFMFLEGGNAWHEIKDIQPFDLYRSAGIGVRFILPMVGLMGFDFGIGFDSEYLYGVKPGHWSDYLRRPFSRVNIVLGFEPY